MLVPLSSMYAFSPRPETIRSAYVRARYEPAAAGATILFPGAAISGFSTPSNRVGPRELYVAITSSDRCGVPRVFSAPTVIAAGAFAGEMTPPTMGRPSSVFPRLPAAATTTSPASTARCTAWQSGSSRYDSNTGWPSDRLMTRSRNCALCSMAQSIALMTSLVSPEPSAPSTRRLTMCAPGAMPAYPPSFLPAMIPATCVP